MSYKMIYSTFKPQDLAFVKSILEETNINYYVKNENVAGIYPLGINMEVFVPEVQAEEAKELIKDFDNKTK